MRSQARALGVEMSFEKVPNFLVNFFEADMNNSETPSSYRFSSYLLDVAERQLSRNDKPVPLTPKAFDVLVYLVEHSGHLVLKDELMQAVWPDSFVDEVNLPRTIHTLRRALGEDENGGKFIETVPTKGYRFVAKVTEERESQERQAEKNEKLPLADGDLPKAIYVDGSVESVLPIPVAERLPEPQSQTRVVLFTVGFLTAVSLILLLSFNFRFGSAPGAGAIKSIAVLPLKPLTAENRNSSYELGIADSLIFKLSSAKGMIVRALAATSRYADIGQDPVAAGREQKVDYVLASNYQIADGKIRITSQLINVQSGQVEGSFKVEQENSTIFAVQDAVAVNIGGPLLKKLNRQSNDLAQMRYTANEEAYRLYLQGLAVVDNRKRSDVGKAIEYFEQAVGLDPDFALAYAELASAHVRSLNDGGRRATEAYLKAKAAIEKALTIDENLAEAHSYLGVIKTNYEWDFAGAELELKRAVDLSPNSSDAHGFYARMLVIIGRFDEAIAEMRTAIELEPASAGNHHSFGWILFQARRYDEAIAEEELALEMNPKLRMSYNVLANSYRLKGDDDKAFEALLRSRNLGENKPEETELYKDIYARSGWRGIYERDLEEEKQAEKKGNPDYADLAGTSIRLGQNEEAIAYLEKAVDQNRFTLITLKVNPRYDPLRSDPRFDDLLRRVGLK